MSAASLNLDDLRAVVRRLPDNGLASAREAALARIGEKGLPTLRDEDWKYTDLAPLVDISNRWLGAGGHQQEQVDQEIVEAVTASIDATWLVIANGKVEGQLLADSPCGGVELARISDAPSDLVISRPLADLNAALLQDGLSIRITGAIDKPIGLLFADTTTEADASVTQTYVDIDVAAGGTADLIEYHVSSGSSDHYANSVLKLTIGDEARVNHVRIQNRSLKHVHTGRTSISPGQNSVLRMAGYDLGGGLIRNDIDIDLSKPGADISFDGLYLAGDGQHIDNHTRVDHRVGPAKSSQEYRGILNGRCRCVWNGKAIVHKNADGTDAVQANHNLLMSEKAEIDAKPELEIYAEDVKCAHGTTVGQLDETALFYLRSRGLDRQHAIRVLTHAFAADLVRRAPVKSAAMSISSIVEARLAELIKSVDIAEPTP